MDDLNDDVIDTLTDKVFGKLYADKGYISQSLFGKLFDNGVHVVTGLRSNMKQRLMSLYDKLKNVAQIVHTRHRSMHNFLMNLLAALGAYCFFAKKPSVNFVFYIVASSGQLTIW